MPARRKRKLAGNFNRILMRVEGEILVVGLPPHIVCEFNHPDEFMNSVYLEHIEYACAHMGCDEIHFNPLDESVDASGEVLILGNQETGDGSGDCFFFAWRSLTSGQLALSGAHKLTKNEIDAMHAVEMQRVHESAIQEDRRLFSIPN